MTTSTAKGSPDHWPAESREAAQLVIDKYGPPDEACDSVLIWHEPGPWKRVVATKEFHDHEFPAPHIDAVTSVIDYRVPPECFTDLARFDGSVVADRTRGELSARCHDEQANFLALNLAHDVVTGVRDITDARAYYAVEFLNARSGDPTPYMRGLRFDTGGDQSDPDERELTPEQLRAAANRNEQSS